MQKFFLGVGAALAALIVPALAGSAELDLVQFDLLSGTINGSLPFDVPFMMVGMAPPGSVIIEGQLDEKNSLASAFSDRWLPETAIVSTVGKDGAFRMRFPALDPNHYFRFRFRLERRLTSTQSLELRRQLESILERHLYSASEEGLSFSSAMALHEEIRVALERALNEGLPIASRGDTLEMDAPEGSIFGDSMTPNESRSAIESITASVLTRHAERAAAVRLYQDTVPNLEAALAAISASADLSVLISALQQAPDLDPRNPRNELHVPEDAARLAELSGAQRLAVARGQSQSERPVDLTDTFSSDDVDRFRARYLRSARALRDLREWLENLVTHTTRHHAIIDERLVDTSALTLEQLDRLRALANPSTGAIRQAERWAETLEMYVYDLQRALIARQRELAAVVAEIDVQAAATVVRQTSVA